MKDINYTSGSQIANAIDKRIIAIAKQVANKSAVNRTVFGRVLSKNNGLFSLSINNNVYNNVLALKDLSYIRVGDKVVCLVPNNQFNDMIILGVADGTIYSTSGGGSFNLNQASSTELGGVRANNRTIETEEVKIDPNTGFLYYSLGKSIESISKTSSSGIVDTYTITYTDGSYTNFDITNADQIELQYSNNEIQWKYATQSNWTTLLVIDSELSTTSNNPIQNQAVATGINNINSKINQNILQNINFSNSSSSFSLIQNLINLSTQNVTQQTVNLPLASSTNSGIMPSSSYNSIQDLENRVGNLEGKTTRLLYTASTNPTASDINTFVTNLGYTSPFEGIAVVINETFHIWHYYENDNIGWKDDGLDTVSNFTNSNAGIILGSTQTGQIFAENDGTGSVNGWDNLNNVVNNATQNISSLTTSLAETDQKAELAQTYASNAVITANNSYNIATQANTTAEEALAQVTQGLGTKVKIDSILQNELNFNSDPQTQITTNASKINTLTLNTNANFETVNNQITSLQNSNNSLNTRLSTAELDIDNNTSEISDLNSRFNTSINNLEDELNNKLDKVTYEYNKEISFGSSGSLFIGVFPIYDTNVTIDISSTTSLTYNGKVIFACQNYVVQKASVFGDYSNTVSPNVFYYVSNNQLYVYFKPTAWSKNIIHITGCSIRGEPTNICQNVSSIPSSANKQPINEYGVFTKVSNGYYVQYANGIMEQHFTVTGTRGSVTTHNYLQPFKSGTKPYVFRTVEANGSGKASRLDGNNVKNVNSSTFQIYSTDIASATNNFISAYGYWE